MSQINGKFIQNATVLLSKLNQSSATSGQFIAWNGSAWTPVTIAYEYLLNAVATSTSNVYASVAALTSVAIPAGTYRWKVTALAQSTANATGVGVRLGLGTAAASVCYGRWLIGQAGDGTAKSFQYDQLTAATNVTSASTLAANTDFVVLGEGVITVTTAGTIAVQLRSETNGTQVSLRPGTVLRLEPIG